MTGWMFWVWMCVAFACGGWFVMILEALLSANAENEGGGKIVERRPDDMPADAALEAETWTPEGEPADAVYMTDGRGAPMVLEVPDDGGDD